MFHVGGHRSAMVFGLLEDTILLEQTKGILATALVQGIGAAYRILLSHWLSWRNQIP